jgi:Endonuclease NucS
VKEIRLWTISTSGGLAISSLASVEQTSTELLLEEAIVKSPDLLGDGTKLIGRQVDTPGGPLDLLGTDEDGSIVVFELKRGELTRDAVAQLLDYASFIASLSAIEFGLLVTKNSGRLGIEKINDFDAWYQEQFGRAFEAQPRPRLALVGLGVDERARRIVEYLANAEIDVSLFTFHGFQAESGTVLARHVEVRQKSASQSARASKDSNLHQVKKRIAESKVASFFESASNSIISWLSPYAWPNQTGFTYYLPDVTEAGTLSNRAYLSLSIPSPAGPAVLTLQDRAIVAGATVWDATEASWTERLTRRKGYVEIRINSAGDWSAISDQVRRLCEAILEQRRSAQTADAKASTDVASELE